MKNVYDLDIYLFCPHCKSELHSEEIDGEKRKVCKACGFIFWNNPKPVVSMLVHRDGKVLMLQRADEPFKEYWVLPGGFIGYPETPQEAVVREVKEETKMDVHMQGLLGAYRIENDPRGVHIDIIYYGSSNDEIMLSKEDTQWKYFDPKDLPKNIAYKHREAIQDWQKVQ